MVMYSCVFVMPETVGPLAVKLMVLWMFREKWLLTGGGSMTIPPGLLKVVECLYELILNEQNKNTKLCFF